MLSASMSMPCSSMARSRPDTLVIMLSSGRVAGVGSPSFIPTSAIASATAQCACTSMTFTRLPPTIVSRRRPWARAGRAASRSQPTNARPASAPADVSRNSLRVVMTGPSLTARRVSCSTMRRLRWPLAVVAAFAAGWAMAGVTGKTPASREANRDAEALRQQVTTLQARLHAREEIAGEPASPPPATSAARREAARLLGSVQVPQSSPLLKVIIERDDDLLLRRAAAAGLRQLQTPDSLPVMEHILLNGADDRFVRLSSAYGHAEAGRPLGVNGRERSSLSELSARNAISRPRPSAADSLKIC